MLGMAHLHKANPTPTNPSFAAADSLTHMWEGGVPMCQKVVGFLRISLLRAALAVQNGSDLGAVSGSLPVELANSGPPTPTVC